jgi:uncharacterized iron-regulated protein
MNKLKKTRDQSGRRKSICESGETFDSIVAESNPACQASIRFIADAWPKLPPHVREAIMTLIDGALAAGKRDEVWS